MIAERIEVQGWAAPGFEPVREAFEQNFAESGEVGAACCVYHQGAPVVDLWGGIADLEQGRPWAEDTLQIVFSATKGVTATCVHRLVEQGALDLDAPIARYWPEFAAAGKGAIPVRHALCHKAGLANVEGDLTLDDVLAWDPVVSAIARQAPNWEPGTAHGYHARSFGWILGELVRRVSGRSLGAYFATEIATPLGLDLHVGLPAELLPRCARLIPLSTEGPSLAEMLGPDSLTAQVLAGPSDLFDYGEMWNRPDVLAAEMPSSNGVGDARSLARLYAAVAGEVDGWRVLAPETLARACAEEASGRDRVLLVPTRFGLGYCLPPMLSRACGEAAFGHPGAGGSLGLGDPRHALGFGYVMNKMKLGVTGDERSERLVEAAYRSIGVERSPG